MFSLLRFGFLLAPLVFCAPGAWAQNSPSLFGSPLPAPNGFDRLFDAVEKTSAADLIASDFEKLSEAESIQQKRNVVSRNKRALFALREALKLPIQHPPVRNAEGDFGNYDGFRILAGILDQEAGVHVSNKDWTSALNSKIDCIELGVLMTRGGPLRAALAGRDIEIIGRRGIDQLVSRVDNTQTLAAAARMNRIETLRPPFADFLREGKIAAIAITREAINERNWDEVLEETTKLDGQPFTEDERETLKNIGENEIVSGIERTFNAALTSADTTYKPFAAVVDYDLDPWSTLLAGAVSSPQLRVDYEAGRAQNQLLALALALRVHRLQNGRYPDAWEATPDPFASGANLQYRRTGESYLLYSVGPNGKDDGGNGIVIPENGQISARANGDLLAPVLPL